MSGCPTCGGFGMHHDPIAHDRRPSGVPEGWWLDVVEADEDELIWVEPEDRWDLQEDGWPRRECDHDGGECHDADHQR